MLPQPLFTHKRAPGNVGTTGDWLIMSLFAAIITAFLYTLSPAAATPVQAHNEPTTCSVSTSAATGNKIVFIYHIRDGEGVYTQQDGVSTRIYRGRNDTLSSGAVVVHISNGWIAICSG